MWKDRSIGAIVMVAGFALVNIAYLWDVLLAKHSGWILLGWKAWIAIVIANLVCIAGMAMTLAQRSTPEGGGSDEPDAE